MSIIIDHSKSFSTLINRFTRLRTILTFKNSPRLSRALFYGINFYGHIGRSLWSIKYSYSIRLASFFFLLLRRCLLFADNISFAYIINILPSVFHLLAVGERRIYFIYFWNNMTDHNLFIVPKETVMSGRNYRYSSLISFFVHFIC